MKTPPLHHHWRMGKFDVNCKRCWELNAGPELLKACEDLLVQTKRHYGTHKDSCILGEECPDKKAIEFAKNVIAKANKEN